MAPHPLDTAIILFYMLRMMTVGLLVERLARCSLNPYFPGGYECPGGTSMLLMHTRYDRLEAY